MQAAIDHFDKSKSRYLETLGDWLKIPSVSTESARAPEMANAAGWAVSRLEEAGFREVELLGPASHPAVFGTLPATTAEAPTVLVYGHYDVQPTAPDELWESGPFTPTIRGERLYARGAADMKGPAFSVLCALDALRQAGLAPRFHVKVLFEGEEELGSPNLPALLEEHATALTSDFCLNPDSGMLAPDCPTLNASIRGFAGFEIHVTGPAQDLHSGKFGGVVHNPAQALCALIAGLHDDRGRVNLPGFYDRVRELDAEERAQLAEQPLDEAFYLQATGAPALWGEAGYTALERIGARPTLEVHGLHSGFTAEGSKTIVPASAFAKLSARLVADQDPEEVGSQLEAYLRSRAPKTINWELKASGGCPPAESDIRSRWATQMLAALEATWERKPVVARVGGTIPVVSQLQRILALECVNVGWALPDSNLHAPNEHLHLPTYFKGIEALIRFFAPA